jgi:hypothetical protein
LGVRREHDAALVLMDVVVVSAEVSSYSAAPDDVVLGVRRGQLEAVELRRLITFKISP